MRVSAKSALFTILTSSILAAAAVIPSNESPSSPAIGDLTTRPQEREGEEKHHASVKFVSKCNDCVKGKESHALFDLVISSTLTVCGETNVRLNGKKIPLQWYGDKAVGQQYVVTDMANGIDRRRLIFECQSVCVKRPQGSIEDHDAQILTVTYYPVREGSAEASGFAVSFNSVGEPEILNLVNSRVEPSEVFDSFGEWFEPTSSQELQIQRYQAPDIDLESDLKELESLTKEAARIDDLITDMDRKIRMRILHDCRYLTSGFKQCGDFLCFIKTSLKSVPDVYRLMKYRFGTLPESNRGNPCNLYLERNKVSNTIFDTSPWNVTEVADGHNNATSGINSTSLIEESPQIRSPSRRKIYFYHIMAGILLVNAIVVMFLRYCHNSLTWQRKRAELAARREERRTLHAYRRAACRYRWRQWWESLFSLERGRSNAESSQHNLTRPEHRRAVGFAPNPDHNTQHSDGTSMGAEILGLRRAFEYVGGLVRYDAEPESGLRPRPNQQAVRELYSGRVGTPAPSSIAPLTTIGSPRTSSVLTYETDSMSTVDSSDIETLTIVSA